MIITCPCGEKKFEIDQKLIPSEGRMLQCGSCDRQWFFKINVPENKIVNEEVLTSEKIDKKTIIDSKNNEVAEEIIKNVSTKKSIKSVKKNKNNYFKLFLVLIISIVALVILIDTFKLQLKIFIPNIEVLLDNLYQSLQDVKLFILDLFK